MKTWTIEVTSDVYAGRPSGEEGQSRDQLVFYVTAHNDRGERFGHFKSFTTEEFSKEEAEAIATRLMGRIEHAQQAGMWKGPVDNEHWRSMHPVYGSVAYRKGDAAFEEGLAEAQAFGEESAFLSSQYGMH